MDTNGSKAAADAFKVVQRLVTSFAGISNEKKQLVAKATENRQWLEDGLDAIKDQWVRNWLDGRVSK